MSNKESFEEWKAGFDGLSFEDSARRYRDKILESPELDDKSRRYFSDAFDYIMNIHLSGRNLDPNLMRIHMTEVKGHKGMQLQEFTRLLMLLGLCGFEFSDALTKN